MHRSVLLSSVLLLLMMPATGSAQSFHYADDCVGNVDNATVLLPSTVDPALPNDTRLASGDTVAVRTSDGTCVGYGAWTDGEPLAIAAAGSTSIEEAESGYSNGSSLAFEVFDRSESNVVEVGSDVQYTSCSNVAVAPCRDDGSYADGAFFVVEALQSTALPVELTDFAATRVDDRVRLKWTTAQEVNNAGFEVQHRQDTSAPASWNTLRFVEGAGTTSETTTYTLKTEPLEVGDHQFRLRQVDQDGTSSLSKKASVKVKLNETYQLSDVAPNPVRTSAKLTVAVQEKQRVTVALYNTLGQRVATLYNQAVPANQKQTIRVRAEDRSSGLYVLRVKGKTFSDTKRMTIVR